VSRPQVILARVLIADDEPAIQRSIAISLSRNGFDVTTVDDGEPAIALVEHGRFDIVVVDYHMRTNGVAVVREYKRCYGARVYCAVLSGEDNDEVRKECLDAGADDVFIKPMPALELRRRLTEAALALRAAVGADERTA
jgi:DNA-binding response OmpR family regulator